MTDLLGSQESEDIKDVVRNDMLVAALVFITYFMHGRSGIQWPYALGGGVVLAALVLRPQMLRSWILWGVVAALLLVDIVKRPYLVANHHYVLTYIALASALSLVADPRRSARLLSINARWLMVGIMGFAVVHKLVSPAYVDGSYLAYMIGDGNLGAPLLGYCEGCMDLVHNNARAVGEFMAASPAAEPVALQSPLPGVDLLTLGRWGAVLVIASELWLVLAYVVIPNHRLTHWSSILFVGGLAFVRQELVFISAVGLLAVLACDGRYGRERRIMAFAILIFDTLAMAGVKP